MLQIFLIHLHAVCEKKRTSVIWQMTGWLRLPVPQAGSQSLLIAAAGAAALLQWARPGPTSCREQPLFLLAGWVESGYGDVLGGSGQGILSRAVSSPNCTQKELFFFFKMLNMFRASRFLVCVPLGDCGWQTWSQLWFSCGTVPAYKQLLWGLCWSLQCVYVVANSIMQEVCAQL